MCVYILMANVWEKGVEKKSRSLLLHMNYEHKYRYKISICLNYFKKLHKRDDLKRRKNEDEQARKIEKKT